MFFFQELYDLSTKIIKLNEIIIKYKFYEKIEEFQILIVRLRTIVEKLENLEINRNNMTTQVNQIILIRYVLLYKFMVLLVFIK